MRILVIFVAILGLTQAQNLRLVAVHDGQPGCFIRYEFERLWRNNFDQHAFWRCERWGEGAVRHECPPYTSFQDFWQTCLPNDNWLWTPYSDPPTRPGEQEIDQCEPIENPTPCPTSPPITTPPPEWNTTTTDDGWNTTTPDSSWNTTTPDSGDWNTTTPDSSWNTTTPDSGDWNTTTPDSGDWNTTTPDSGDWNTTTPDSGDWNTTTPDSGDWNTTTPDSGWNTTTPDPNWTTTPIDSETNTTRPSCPTCPPEQTTTTTELPPCTTDEPVDPTEETEEPSEPTDAPTEETSRPPCPTCPPEVTTTPAPCPTCPPTEGTSTPQTPTPPDEDTSGICPGAEEHQYAPGDMDCQPPPCTWEQWLDGTLYPSRNPQEFFQCGPGEGNMYVMPCGPGTCFSFTEQVCVHVVDWRNYCTATAK
uniref:Putative mucin-2 isoform x2 biarmipes n=1 Tax=Lutzomyia longipalpis TaxID=7200 RepID=A0A1B0CKI3_LUTLO